MVDTSEEKSHGYVRVLDTAWQTIRQRPKWRYDLPTLREPCWRAISYHWYDDGRMAGYRARIGVQDDPTKSRPSYFEAGRCGAAFLIGYLLLEKYRETGDFELFRRARAVADPYVKPAYPLTCTFLTTMWPKDGFSKGH